MYRWRMATKRTPAQRLIDDLGGFAALARALGRPKTTVSSWYHRGHIPARRLREVAEAARRVGVELRVDHFVDCAREAPPAAPSLTLERAA